jgi:hypothetical protein
LEKQEFREVDDALETEKNLPDQLSQCPFVNSLYLTSVKLDIGLKRAIFWQTWLIKNVWLETSNKFPSASMKMLYQEINTQSV